MVGLSGLEPPTSRLSGVRSNRLSYKPTSVPLDPLLVLTRLLCLFFRSCRLLELELSLAYSGGVVHSLISHFSALRVSHACAGGGDEEDRTPDPLLARQVLSQLSYTPMGSLSFFKVHLSPFTSLTLRFGFLWHTFLFPKRKVCEP